MMPRRDGFDTNQEMLADFNAQAHGVFVDTYEKHFTAKYSGAYDGKPLDALHLRLTRTLESPASDDQVRRQTLKYIP